MEVLIDLANSIEQPKKGVCNFNEKSVLPFLTEAANSVRPARPTPEMSQSTAWSMHCHFSDSLESRKPGAIQSALLLGLFGF